MDELVSKSQKKREADYLQKVGLKLVDLSITKLAGFPLPENLYKAILDAKSIKSHGAKRRQAQLIGKLMRSADFEAIIATYEHMEEEDSAVTQGFHEIELWRDKLINNSQESLTEFINSYHPEDIQQLRQLIKKAQEEKLKDKNLGAAKALFRLLRGIIQ